MARWVAADDPSRTILLGGVAALSAEVEAGLPRTRRVAGAERTATAAEVARQLWGQQASGRRSFAVINGFSSTGWALGLALAGTAADADAPLLLVTPKVTGATLPLVGACGAPQVDLLLVGDHGAIPRETEAELTALDGGAC